MEENSNAACSAVSLASLTLQFILCAQQQRAQMAPREVPVLPEIWPWLEKLSASF